MVVVVVEVGNVYVHFTQPRTCLRVHLSVCKRREAGRNTEEGKGDSEREGGQLKGLEGKMWSSIAGSRSREKIIGR